MKEATKTTEINQYIKDQKTMTRHLIKINQKKLIKLNTKLKCVELGKKKENALMDLNANLLMENIN